MSNLTTFVNTANTISVTDFSYNIANLVAIDASASILTASSRQNAINTIENSILLNLAKGKGAVNATLARTRSANEKSGTLDSTFGQNVLVNNTIMDTPNAAIMCFTSDVSFQAYSFTSVIGNNGQTVTAPVFDEASCNVITSEVMRIDLCANNTASYSSGNWSATFDSADLQCNLSRAVNSRLLARKNGNAFDPLTVTEPSFNTTFALCAEGTQAFQKYYNVSAGAVPTAVTFDYSNNVIKSRSKSVKQTAGATMYTLQSKQNQNVDYRSYEEVGTFRFIQQPPTITVTIPAPSPPLGYLDTWSSTENRYRFEIVKYGGIVYEKTQNIGNFSEPGVFQGRADWAVQPLYLGNNNGIWSATTINNVYPDWSSPQQSYAQGSVVKYNGKYYQISYVVFGYGVDFINPNPALSSNTQEVTLPTVAGVYFKGTVVFDPIDGFLYEHVTNNSNGLPPSQDPNNWYLRGNYTSPGVWNSFARIATYNLPAPNLPLLYLDPSNNPPGVAPPTVFSDVSFNILFPDINNGDDFSFNIATTNNNGGYTFATDVSNLFTLDSTNLTNNYAYMQTYLNTQHALNISGGTTTIDASNNSFIPTIGAFSLSTDYESLDSTKYSQNGAIVLGVQSVTSRIKNVDLSAGGPLFTTVTSDLSAIVVAYDASDSDYITTNLNLSGITISDISQNAVTNGENLKFSENTSITVKKWFDGYDASWNDAYRYFSHTGGPNAIGTDALDDFSSNQTLLYSTHNFTDDQLQFSAQNPSGQLMLIRVNGAQSLTAADSSGFYFLNRDQSGNVPPTSAYFTLGGSKGPFYFASDASAVGYKSNISFDCSVKLQNFTIADLSFTNYRTLFLPRTLNELISTGDLSFSNTLTFECGKENKLNNTNIIQYSKDISASYLYLSTQNLVLNGITYLDSANIGPINHGVDILDLNNAVDSTNTIVSSNASAEYTFDLSYNYSNKSVSFKARNPELIKTVGLRNFAIQCVLDSNPLNDDLRFVTQFPFGNYSNLYFHTEYVPNPVEFFDTYTSSITIKQNALLGLKAFLQGGGGQDLPASDYRDVSLNWTNINRTPIYMDEFSKKIVNKDTLYFPLKSYANLSALDPITGVPSSGSITISIIDKLSSKYGVLNYYVEKVDSELYMPGYSVALVDDYTNISVDASGRIFNTTDISNLLSPNYDWSQLNPAKFATDATMTSFLQKGRNLDITVTPTLSNFKRSLAIRSNLVSDFSANITMPWNTPANFSFWYCPQDVWRVQVTNNGTALNPRIAYSNTANRQVKIADGIVLTQTKTVLPGNNVTFSLANQLLAVNMVNGTSNLDASFNRYDVSTNPIEMSGNLLSLGQNNVFDANQHTRSISIPSGQYRGYHSNSSGTLDTQIYKITRNKSTYRFSLGSLFSTATDMYYNRTVTGIEFPSPIGSFGLNATFKQSILAASPTQRTFPINVTSDSVSLRVVNNGTTITSDLSLNAQPIYLSGNANQSAFFPGRVTSGTGNSRSNNSYTIRKLPQNVLVQQKPFYFSGDPSGNFDQIPTPLIGWMLPNSTLVAGYNLTASIKVTLAEGFYLSSDTGGQFLVSAAPYYTFTEFNINAPGAYDLNRRLIPFDTTGVSTNTWSLPSTNNGTTDFNPYPSTSGVNNVTFRRAALGQSMGSTVGSSTTATVSIPVNGNTLILQETLSGQGQSTITRYSDLVQKITDGFSGNGSARLDASAGYFFQYDQSGSYPGIELGKVYAYIGNPFCQGRYDISINPIRVSNSAIYSVAPYIDGSGNYQLQAYKFTNSQNVNNGLALKVGNSAPSKYVHYATDHKTRNISLPTVTFGTSAYNLASLRDNITNSNVAGSWTSDPSFIPQELPFNLTSLSAPTGNTIVQNMFNLNPAESMVNVKYLTMPDLFQATSADGSPVFRITYNGSVASSLISTTQLTLTPNASTIKNDNVSSPAPNAELVDYNVGTFLMATPDVSGIIYA